jgi:hypothetical protein
MGCGVFAMNIRAKIFGGGEGIQPSPLVETKKPKGAKGDLLDSVKVARRESRRGNTRGNDRHRLPSEQVVVKHGGNTQRVQLINLSGGGAMIEGPLNAKLWDRIDLQLGEGSAIECAVRWIRDGRFGLEFAHETRIECAPDEQAALLRETVARSFPDVSFEVPETNAAPVRQTGDQDEVRRERRHPLIWSGQIHHDYQSTPVRLRNISSTGAAIECNVPLRVGAEPLLDLGEAGQVFATVTWVVGDQAGLKFQQSYDLSQLSRAKPDVAPATWEAPSYLKPDSPVVSPWADEWGRMSLGELRDELEGFMKR